VAIFDGLINDLATKWHLGARAPSLVGELLHFISGGTDGVAGFVDWLKSAGLGAEVDSWIGKADSPAAPAKTIEKIIDAETLSGIAARVGLPVATATTAAGVALPKLIGMLTQGGAIPKGVPAVVSGFLSSLHHGTPSATQQVPPLEMSVIPDQHRSNWFWPLFALVALGAAGWLYQYLLPPPVVTASVPAVSPPTATAASTAAVKQSQLLLTNNNGDVTYVGRVKDEATRTSLIDAIKAAFGADKVRGEINVDPNATSAPWLSNLSGVFSNLRLNGVRALFDGASIGIGGLIGGPDRDKLIAAIKSLFGGSATVGNLSDNISGLVTNTTDWAYTWLSNLKPGYTVKDVVTVLNTVVSNFATGSADVPTESVGVLKLAADKLRGFPAGTVVEISGHTDTTGDAAANMLLSQQRAESVRRLMIEGGVNPAMLTAKGYGGTMPVAPNDSVDGQYRNRRIEFHVVSG
jgi:uncharacterized protein YidB (DUF937 family)